MRNRIKELRFKNGLTQTQLAKDAKICRQTISLIERSKCIPSLLIATRISKVFNEPVTNIFIFEEEELF
ncbi:helix-turn-helix transcriptional regulator [Priestia endophytica]|uniref:helix-turn-helix transcriptional regulator n=1 Tax=Priestia endophytica TaxID=135735 RepID=UPI000DCA803E|nr:helix-turn-helix transcriptional regulator [Priestia endophytica]RAS73163.1 transcriptional regulator [Priestia endophytica]